MSLIWYAIIESGTVFVRITCLLLVNQIEGGRHEDHSERYQG